MKMDLKNLDNTLTLSILFKDIVVDSNSKWLEVLPVSSMSMPGAIHYLHFLFATHGQPDAVVSGNATTLLV